MLMLFDLSENSFESQLYNMHICVEHFSQPCRALFFIFTLICDRLDELPHQTSVVKLYYMCSFSLRAAHVSVVVVLQQPLQFPPFGIPFLLTFTVIPQYDVKQFSRTQLCYHYNAPLQHTCLSFGKFLVNMVHCTEILLITLKFINLFEVIGVLTIR